MKELSALAITIQKYNMLTRFLEVKFNYAKALTIKQIGWEEISLPNPTLFAVSVAKEAIRLMTAQLNESTLDHL